MWMMAAPAAAHSTAASAISVSVSGTAGFSAGAGPDAAAQRVVDALHDRFPHYDWVGIYWVDGSDLVLGPWVGPQATEHTRIPIGTGVCGAAAASGRTEIVPDVDADPRYLSCFASTRSDDSRLS